jgi:hypothetical protein
MLRHFPISMLPAAGENFGPPVRQKTHAPTYAAKDPPDRHRVDSAAQRICRPRFFRPLSHRVPSGNAFPCYIPAMVFGKEQIVRNGAEANALMSEVFAMQSVLAGCPAACLQAPRTRADVAGYSYRFC